jgi:hypothetical protein
MNGSGSVEPLFLFPRPKERGYEIYNPPKSG